MNYAHILFKNIASIILIAFTIVFLPLKLFSSPQYNSDTPGSDTTKVLFIGNSYTGGNNLPGIVRQLAVSSNKQVIIDKYIRPGTSLEEISLLAQTREKIYQNNWDYVVLQGGCHNAAYPDSHHIIIPYAGYRPLPPTLRKLRDMAWDNFSATRVIYFMPWAFKDGITWVPGYTDTYEDMQGKIYQNSLIFASDLDLTIAPVGWSWYRVIRENPQIELFHSDMSHASLKGSYLAACVFYATLFQEELSSTYYNSIPSSQAQYFQAIASSVVLDSLSLWRIVPTSVKKYKTTKPSEFELFQNYPNPFNSSTTIKFHLPKPANIELKIFDINGELITTIINSVHYSPGDHYIRWNGRDAQKIEVSSGFYICRLESNNTSLTKKLLFLK